MMMSVRRRQRARQISLSHNFPFRVGRPGRPYCLGLSSTTEHTECAEVKHQDSPGDPDDLGG